MPGFAISEVPFPPAPTLCPDGVGPKMPLNADVEEPSVSLQISLQYLGGQAHVLGYDTHYTGCLSHITWKQRLSRRGLGWAQHE